MHALWQLNQPATIATPHFSPEGKYTSTYDIVICHLVEAKALYGEAEKPEHNVSQELEDVGPPSRQNRRQVRVSSIQLRLCLVRPSLQADDDEVWMDFGCGVTSIGRQ